MKRLIFTLLLSVSLTACDTMSDISMPNMSSLNPFGTKGETEQAASNTATPQPATAQANLSPAATTATATEMAEMEFLTGTAPRFDMVAPATVQTTEQMPDAAVENVTADTLPAQEYHKTTKVETGDAIVIDDKDLPITEDRVAEVNAAIERELAPKPIPAAKPANAVAEAAPVTVPVEQQLVQIDETAPALPVQQTQEDTALAQQPQVRPVEQLIEQPIEHPVAQPVFEEPVVTEPVIAAPVMAEPAVETPVTTDYADAEPVLNRTEGCPMVEIMPSARSITYFENEMSGQMVARAAISEIRGGCEYKNGGMEIDLDILMKGKITKLGRFEGNEDMEAFMTFPYFVAVSTPQGLPVDKQILATAMQFKPMVDDLDHAEKITQFIPLANPREGANYKILVGFQLNRKQMEYNRAVNINRLDNDIVSPDVIDRSRISVNPLAD